MKVLKRWFLPLLALLLVAAGAALPYTISALQDSTVEAMRENRMLNEVNLTLQKGEDVQDVLRLLAGSTSEMEWRGRTEMTMEEAAAAAEEAMRQLDESGLTALLPELPGYDYEYTMSAEPSLIMSMNESSLSAVVWLCWAEEMPFNWVVIDDKMGKMVRAFLNETGLENVSFNYSAAANSSTSGKDGILYIAGSQEFGVEAAVRRADLWRNFLSGYYGTELVFANTAGEDIEIYDDGYSGEFSLAFDSDEWRDTGMVMRLELHGTGVYFNA